MPELAGAYAQAVQDQGKIGAVSNDKKFGALLKKAAEGYSSKGERDEAIADLAGLLGEHDKRLATLLINSVAMAAGQKLFGGAEPGAEQKSSAADIGNREVRANATTRATIPSNGTQPSTANKKTAEHAAVHVTGTKATQPNSNATTFAMNEAWHDDDVRAVPTGGRSAPVQPTGPALG